MDTVATGAERHPRDMIPNTACHGREIGGVRAMTLEVGIAKRTLDTRLTALLQKGSKPLNTAASARCNPDRAIDRSAPGFLVFVPKFDCHSRSQPPHAGPMKTIFETCQPRPEVLAGDLT